MSLLFCLAEWHALTKLRMHTETTLKQMKQVTTILGSQLRNFCNITCKDFKTTELPKEAEARARKEARQRSKQASKVVAEAIPQLSSQTSAGQSKAPSPAVSSPKGKKPKTLNLLIYKAHALGDYADTIRQFGTSDSYSSQLVSILFVSTGYTYLHISREN
jgi:hypothetical protein